MAYLKLYVSFKYYTVEYRGLVKLVELLVDEIIFLRGIASRIQKLMFLVVWTWFYLFNLSNEIFYSSSVPKFANFYILGLGGNVREFISLLPFF